MSEFLLIGAFPNELPEGVTNYYHTADCQGWNEDFLISKGGEMKIIPQDDQKIDYQNKTYSWFKYQSDQDKINLKNIFKPNDGVVAYAACWIESDKKQDKVFGFGSNDGAKVWLNGELIHQIHMPRPAELDDDYFRASFKKGKNLLLIKIDQGFGGWGFILRPVNEQEAWKEIKKRIDRELMFDFKREGNYLISVVGDPLSLAAFKSLPSIKIEFSGIHLNHHKTITARIGSTLKLPAADFPDSEYAVIAYIPIDKNTVVETHGYMYTKGDIVKETRALIYKKLPQLPASPRAEYLQDFLTNLRWMDKANKMWGHAYGYRRYLDGLKNVFNEAEKLKNSDNPFDGLFLKPKKVDYKNGKTTVDKSWRIIDENGGDDFIKVSLERFWQDKFAQKPVYGASADGSDVIVLQVGDWPQVPPLEDGYYLEIDGNKIIVKGRSRRALFYGLSTLLDLLKQSLTIPNAVVLDWPSARYRSVLAGGTKISDSFRKKIEAYAQRRFNMVYISSDANYLHLENSESVDNLREMYDFCRSRFMEPIPYIETFGAGTLTKSLDPCLAEGIYHEKEPWQVPEDGLLKLKVPRILDCENTTLHIFTQNRDELQRDGDYKIISVEKPQIQILNKQYYHKKLLLSYDAVDFSKFIRAASCPSDPKGWELEDKVIGNILKVLKPKYLHISQDEAGALNRDSRCKARGLSNAEILIDELNHVHRIIRKYDKNVEIHMWGDQFNDFQNAAVLGATGAVKGIPRDIVVLDWNYVGVYHWQRQTTYNMMRNYTQYGMRVVGVSWWEPVNVMDIEMSGARTPRLYLGMMHTAWAGFKGGFLPTAEANWTGSTILGKIAF